MLFVERCLVMVCDVPNPPQTSRLQRVMVVEDEATSRRAMTLLLRASGYRPQAYGTAEEALRAAREGNLPHLALVDLDLPGMNGLELIACLEQLDPEFYPILVTATDADTLAAKLKEHPVAYLRKPVNFDGLLEMLSDRQQPH